MVTASVRVQFSRSLVKRERENPLEERVDHSEDRGKSRPSGSLDTGLIKENSLIDQIVSTTEAAEIVVPVMSIVSTTEPAEIVVPMMGTNGPKIEKSRKVKKVRKSRRKGLSKARKNLFKSSDIRLHFGEFKPLHIVDKAKMFPKFRRRITDASQARSFAFRTLTVDKEKFDRNESPNAVDSQQRPVADSTNENDVKSAQLLEEIIALETMMTSLEKKVEEAHNGTLHEEGTKPAVVNPSSQKFGYNVDSTADISGSSSSSKQLMPRSFPIVKDQESPLDISSVSSQSGFLPMANKSQKGFHQQPIHFIIETATTIEISRWSDWSEWGDCFCDKELRTRRCIYSSSMSHGCEGESYESRNCTGGWCVTSPPPVRGESTKLNRSPVRSLS
uniref:Ty3-gypsy retrotransposon protein n=1 Tax=Angiostrongylus cantonensis TaxID=6313 RepID=A0A158PAD7_ANGCA